MKSTKLIFELDHKWTINSFRIDCLHAMNRLRYFSGTPINIKRIEYENKQNNNIY